LTRGRGDSGKTAPKEKRRSKRNDKAIFSRNPAAGMCELEVVSGGERSPLVLIPGEEGVGRTPA